MIVRTMKVGTRLGLSFALILLLLIAITAIGLVHMAKIQDRLDEVTKINNVEEKLVLEMRATLSDRLISLRNMALTNEVAVIRLEAERIGEQAKKYAAAEAELNAMFAIPRGASSDEKASMLIIKEQEKAALPLMTKAAELAQTFKADEAARVLMTDLRLPQAKWRAALVELIAMEDKLNEQAATVAAAAYADARALMLVLGGLSLLIGIMTAVLMSRGLLKQLGGEPDYAAGIVEQIAAGNLAVEITNSANDRSSLLSAIRAMAGHLAALVGEVRAGTDAIAAAASQIASGNLNLSARTERQAGALEETASAMRGLTLTVKQNAEHAQDANRLAQSASDAAIQGGAAVTQVAGTMISINASSRRIVDIIGVIDGIAFQTNILALNAAVESARAGEHGRGFAVVAGEVRNLAQHSAAAAREIKTLIVDSVEEVEGGVKLVNQAAATMDGVVATVKRVTEIMGRITAATQEQSLEIEHVHQAISQMDKVTQQNAAMVEESAAAADSLHEQAGNLVQMVSVFKLHGTYAGEAAAKREAILPLRVNDARVIPMTRVNRSTAVGGRVATDVRLHRMI